ncbi:hypothetical protein ABMA27_001769 [Loxostege sticticalis]|uniref:RNA-directed DNA polymerase n=1 Tax=Loxostege sticticalis TaxID=481309 RepID=A0ABR3HZM7_LOXSC
MDGTEDHVVRPTGTSHESPRSPSNSIDDDDDLILRQRLLRSELERRSRSRHMSDELERRSRSRHMSNELERCSAPRHVSGELERHSRSRLSHCRNDGELEQHQSTLRHFSANQLSDELERRSFGRYDRRQSSVDDYDRLGRKRARNRTPELRTPARYQDPSCSTSRDDSPPPAHRARYGTFDNSLHNLNNNDILSQFVSALKDIAKSGSHKINAGNNVIPEFDPLSKNQNIVNWLTKVEECAEIYNWDEREIIHYALPKLTGLAKSWYQSLPSVRFTWAEWKAKLVDSFPCRENYAELLTDMLALKARFGEPLEQYFYSKLNLLNRCNIKGRQAVDCILHGIEDRSIRLGAQAAQFDLPEQVLKYLKTVKVGNTRESVLNTNRARADKRQLNNKPTMTKNSANSSKPPIKCFNCGLEGHPSFLCTKPIEKCSGCHRIGHKITSCPNAQSRGVQSNEKSNGKEKQVLRVCVSNTSVDKNITILNVENDHLLKEKSLSDNSRDKYFMTIEVNHKPLDCYVDLGSECSLIRRTDALKLGVEQNSDNLPLLKGVGNNCLRAMSRIEANVNVQGITLPINMYVVDDSAIKQPILLGQNFTEHPSIMITKTPSQLIFEDSSSMHKLCLTTQKTTTIPQQDIKAIPVICSTPYSGKIYVHGSVRGKAGAEYFLLPGEYELSEGKGNLLVQNIAAGPIKFLSNSLITRAIPVSSAREVFDISKIDIDYNTLNCGSLINDDQKQELKSLLDRYSDCFSNNLKDLGFTSATEMEIHLSDSDPIVYRPYRMAQSERTLVRDMVQEMLDANIIRESSSPYASPIVLVKKKTGEKRLCIDYRALNRKTIKDHYPLPRVEDQLDLLAGHKFFITLDLASGYYQIPIKEESRQKTAFVTPDGQFEYLRMPFGLVNAPSVFQRTINKILAEAKIKYAMVYMDDILIPAHDFSEGLARLQEVLDLLRSGGLTLKLSKCYFFYDKIDYLGFEVGSEGIRPGSRKTEAVSSFPVPKSQHEVRQFIGLASFFRRFVRDFAIIASPLTDLLKKNSQWEWTEKHNTAFQTLKNALVERPILALYDPSLATELHTDASKIGVAGILFQKNPEGVLRPVSFYSRKTTLDEQKMHSFELETLAVVASLARFRVYLLGVPFKIYTDCNALRTAMTKRDLVPRIARWWVQLQEFDCSFEYRSGVRMAHVDALSRNPVAPAIPETHILDVLTLEKDDWISTVQLADDEINSIKNILENPESEKILDIINNYCLKNGRVYRKVHNELRWVVPKSVRWQVLKMNHDDVGHFGFEKTLSRIKESYWFPKLRRFVKKYVSACLECAYHKAQGGPRTGELHPIPKIEIPFHTIHADHLGPFVRSKRGNSYLLVIIDGFTKFINITPVRNTKATTTIRVFREHISYFGTPTRLITDQGSCFTSHVFKKFIKTTGIKHILNAVASPRANGQVERFNRTILDALSTKSHSKDDRTWDDYVPDIQIGLNTTVHNTTKKSPSELLFGYKLINTSEAILNEVINDTLNITPADELSGLRQETGERIREQQAKDKIRFDKTRKTGKTYKEGELVRVERMVNFNDGKSKKLVAKYQGPYRIKKILPNDRFLIEDTPLTRKNNRRYEAIVAIDKIQPWLNFSTNYDSSDDESDNNSDENHCNTNRDIEIDCNIDIDNVDSNVNETNDIEDTQSSIAS